MDKLSTKWTIIWIYDGGSGGDILLLLFYSIVLHSSQSHKNRFLKVIKSFLPLDFRKEIPFTHFTSLSARIGTASTSTVAWRILNFNVEIFRWNLHKTIKIVHDVYDLIAYSEEQ